MAELYIYMSHTTFCLFISWWTFILFLTFLALWIVLLCSIMYKFLCNMFSVLLDLYLGVAGWYGDSFLKRSLVFPLLLFSSNTKQYSLKKAFLSLLAIFWNSVFNWMYLSRSPLLFASLRSSAIYKASSDNHFSFLPFFFFGMVLFAASCIISWTSLVVLQAHC